jgi:hypothetical protein
MSEPQGMSDLDIWRCADLFVRQHGQDAAIFVASRADSLLAKGDLEGSRVWKRILKAVEQILETASPSSVH